jgi:hypothetical protein
MATNRVSQARYVKRVGKRRRKLHMSKELRYKFVDAGSSYISDDWKHRANDNPNGA